MEQVGSSVLHISIKRGSSTDDLKEVVAWVEGGFLVVSAGSSTFYIIVVFWICFVLI